MKRGWIIKQVKISRIWVIINKIKHLTLNYTVKNNKTTSLIRSQSVTLETVYSRHGENKGGKKFEKE